MYKPSGYTSLSPYLIVADIGAALAFIKAAFGAEPLFIHRRPDGGIGHVELRIDDSILMLGQSDQGASAHLHVYVPDVDATFAKAKAAGGSVVQEVGEKGDGDRRGGIADPTGTVWWLSTALTARG